MLRQGKNRLNGQQIAVGFWVRRLSLTSKVATAVSHTSPFARLETGRRSAGIARGSSDVVPATPLRGEEQSRAEVFVHAEESLQIFTRFVDRDASAHVFLFISCGVGL